MHENVRSKPVVILVFLSYSYFCHVIDVIRVSARNFLLLTVFSTLGCMMSVCIYI